MRYSFGFSIFFNLTTAKNVLLDMRSKDQLLTQAEKLLQSNSKSSPHAHHEFVLFSFKTRNQSTLCFSTEL